MNKDIISVNKLLSLNEMMLCRGMPVTEDGVGYNKADYGACSNYYYGLSDAQVADLAKRLVKYSTTQLGIDKQQMKDTAEYYASLVNGQDRSDGVSINVTDNGTLISFRYNETFIETIKSLPKRQFDGDSKQWIVPNSCVVMALEKLRDVGADVDNALEYAKNHELCKEQKQDKVDVLTKIDGDYALIKFDYNKDIVNAVKSIDYKDRNWNPEFKFWSIKQNHLDKLKETLSNIANFKLI